LVRCLLTSLPTLDDSLVKCSISLPDRHYSSYALNRQPQTPRISSQCEKLFFFFFLSLGGWDRGNPPNKLPRFSLCQTPSQTVISLPSPPLKVGLRWCPRQDIVPEAVLEYSVFTSLFILWHSFQESRDRYLPPPYQDSSKSSL